MNNKRRNNYVIFLLTQSISQLGSGMTSYALILWTYLQTNSVLNVSLLTFFSYVPYIIISIFAGAFVDNHKKKTIILYADIVASLCTVAVSILYLTNSLQIWIIYITNSIIGFMNAFQSPASRVAVGIIVPKNYIEKYSGMESFSYSLNEIVKPVLAVSLLTLFGLEFVLIFDLITFLIAIITLIFFINIPEEIKERKKGDRYGVLSGVREGLIFLKTKKGLLYLMLSMALINFFSRITYENILSPMLISRSHDATIAGIITSIMGIAGVIGGALVTLIKLPKNKVKIIYLSAAFSFLIGDLLMGFGQNVFIWSIAAIGACIPISFINAGQSYLLYHHVPKEIQGRVFAVRNIFQYSTIPVGILLGGILADYVFEPFMNRDLSFTNFLHKLVGNGAGSGMALMFLCTGILGFISSILWYKNKTINSLNYIE